MAGSGKRWWPACVETCAVAALLLCPATATADQQPMEQSPSNAAPASQELRTFTLAKPPHVIEEERRATATERDPTVLPSTRDRLRLSVGMGYVQAADWGTEIGAGGAIKGIQIQSTALLTKGATGYLFDNGALSLFDPDLKWRAEAGDVFSHLRGASRGARFSWSAAGRRQPAISLYGPRRGLSDRSTVVSYRDQLVVGEQTLVDAEVTSDWSYLLRSRLVFNHLEFEGVHRTVQQPVKSRDVSLFAGYVLGAITITGGLFRSQQLDDRNDWRTVSVSFPLSRHVHLTLERAFTATPATTTTTSAAMAHVTTGAFRFFHRQQFGEFEREHLGIPEALHRQQTQSAASYGAGHRFDLTLQMATQRTESGLIQHWEELQATAAVTPSTSLRVAGSVPDFGNTDRFRALLRQELPARFALQAEYGRLAAFQYAPFVEDRPRFKFMLYKSWNIGTPTRGAVVRGRVLDHTGRAVAGARVKLGRYQADTDRSGQYIFRYVPRGDYELALVPAYLPADYAWDGRRIHLALTTFAHVTADLLVAPLNAIHGRVYVDHNQNGRFDGDEGLTRAVVHLGDRVTSTDENGAYSFYNVNPGRHTVRLNTDKLPSELESTGATERTVELGDTGPVTDVEFRVVQRVKPIIFQRPER